VVGANNSALLITLEHRYYGASQPFADWSTHNLEFLTSEQALADVAYFIDAKNQQFITENGRKPDWVLIGGSYPGALTAWFKSKYPNHVIGGWSSSGVINAVNDFYNFDYSNYNNTLKSGALCPQLIQDQYKYVEQQFSTEAGKDKICT